MGIEYENDKLDEILRLTRENNRMLHSMRRSAWLGGIFRIITWAAFVIIPLWLYMTYLAPMMQSMLETYQQLAGTSAQVQTQYGQMSSYLQQIQSLFGGGTQ